VFILARVVAFESARARHSLKFTVGGADREELGDWDGFIMPPRESYKANSYCSVQEFTPQDITDWHRPQRSATII
jgi:hypothetical protein